MRTNWILGVMVAGAVALGGFAMAEEKAEGKKMTIKQIMKVGHKDKDKETGKTLLETVLTGKASEKQVKDLHAMYVSMAGQKAKKGDAADWKKRVDAILKASEAVTKGNEGALKELKAATACKACHDMHK